MRSRTKAREYALQILYQLDVTGDDADFTLLNFFESTPNIKPEEKNFACAIVKGVRANIKIIDDVIAKYADNWDIKRMAYVDRNVLRLSIFELLFTADTPTKVCINEGIELAKRFGDTDSGRFVNGILDKISKAEKIAEKRIEQKDG